MAATYKYALSEAAGEYAFRLSSQEQNQLVSIFRSLTNQPHQSGDYSTADDTGRPVQNLLIEGWVVTFWSDHAAKEVRIVDLLKV